EAPHLSAADEFPLVAEHAQGDVFAVDVEPDIQHRSEVGVTQNLDVLVPRYPTDRGPLHSFTPRSRRSTAPAAAPVAWLPSGLEGADAVAGVRVGGVDPLARGAGGAVALEVRHREGGRHAAVLQRLQAGGTSGGPGDRGFRLSQG